MANLRRTKIKAKRMGCDIAAVDKCENTEAVLELMNKPKDEDNGSE